MGHGAVVWLCVRESSNVCHLGNIATRPGCMLKWDDEREQFIGDRGANRLPGYACRKPWDRSANL